MGTLLGGLAVEDGFAGMLSRIELNDTRVALASQRYQAVKATLEAALPGKKVKQIGSFQRNVVDSNIRSLGVARENLSDTESAIRDVDIAAEMTTFSKLQILQQSGLAVLAQANAQPRAVLSLLQG